MTNPNGLTTVAGAPVPDNQNSVTAGARGPLLLQDVWLLEKLAHFDREVIPERRMHAKGSAAFGTFRVTHDITAHTNAAVFSEIGKQIEIFMRFSTVAGERGAADAERDIRGFAVRFYTEQGNWDVVGNNSPVFFFRDPLKFPDLNHAVKRDPKTNLRSAENNWDFWTNLPEALHQITIVMSDRGIPDGYRHMHGFGSHTFSFVNDAGERSWVKFHFRTQQGIKNLTDEEAAVVIAGDRESAQRDLFDAIEEGNYPKWTLFVQIMPEADAQTYRYHPFDLTKVWSKKDYPLIEVGELELDRNPRTTTPTSSRPRSPRRTSFPASASPRTACSKAGCSPTATPPATGSASTTTRFRSTVPGVQPTSIPSTVTASCASTATRAASRASNPTRTADSPTSVATPNRHSKSAWSPTGSTTEQTTTTTSNSPATSSAA